jgi:hypothetical protein
MDEKPWLSLIPFDNTKWWIASKNLYLPDNLSKTTQIVRAYFIIHDGNGYSSYYRYFYWFYGNNQRHFDVDGKWYFDKPMCDCKNGDIVIETRTQQKYVVNDKFNNPYIKILEIS